MRLITKTQSFAWHTDNGRELIQLSGKRANVTISSADADELDMLATACLEASRVLRDRAEAEREAAYRNSINASQPTLNAAAERDKVAVS